MLGGKVKQFKKPILALLIAILVVVNSLVFMATSTAVEKEAVDVSKIKNTISFDVEKYVNYEIENEKGALIQLTGKTGLTFDAGQKEIPLERIGVRFVAPKIKDSYPESVEVLNGFVKSYDKQSGVIILGATKDFSMLLNYGEKAYFKEPAATELVLKGDLASKLQNDSNKSLNQIVMGKFEQKIKLEEKAGLISSEIETTPLYNGFINRNIDTDYQEKYSVAISKKELGDKITLEINNQFGKNEVKNVSTTFNKSNVLSILGEKGSLKILDGEKVLQEINKDTKVDEKDLITYNYDEKVSNIKIEISKPEKVGTIKFINAKQIKADLEDKTANKINVQNKFTVTKNNAKVYEYTENKELNVNEAKPQVVLETNNNTWTNNDINNVEFIVKMPINENNCSLFNNPVITIKLPEEVVKAIVDEDVLGKTVISNPNGLTINTIQYNENDKIIQIALIGDQKELVNQKDVKETEIRIPVLVKMVNPLTNANTIINVECKNTNIFTNSEEIGTSNLEIKLEDMNKVVNTENVVTEENITEVVANKEKVEEKQSKNMTLTVEPNPALRNFFEYTLNINDSMKANDKITINIPSFMQYDNFNINKNIFSRDILSFECLNENTMIYKYEEKDLFKAVFSEDRTKIDVIVLNDCENFTINLGTQTKNDRLLEIAKTISGNTVDAKLLVTYVSEDNTYNLENAFKIGINKVSVNMESLTEGEFVQKGDTVTYKIKVKNEGKVIYDPSDLYFVNMILHVKTPEEISELKATYNNWEVQNIDDDTKQLVEKTFEEDFSPISYDNNENEIPNVRIQLLLPYNETSEVILTGKVNSSVNNKDIKARALVSNNLGTFNYNYQGNDLPIVYKENFNSVYSNIVTHRLQKEEIEGSKDNKVNIPIVINNDEQNKENDIEQKTLNNDFKVENYITKITTKTEDEIIEHEVNDKNASNVILNTNEIEGNLEQVEYKIVVTNNGETAGTLEKIVDYLPQGLSLDKLSNANWTENTDGTVENRSLSTKVLQPGESEEVKLVLTKNDEEKINTTFNNKVMIPGANNTYNHAEVDLQNNTANAELIITNNNIALYIIIAVIVVLAILIILNIKYKIFKFTKIKILSLIVLSVIIVGGYSSIAYNATNVEYDENSGIVTIKRRLWITSRVTEDVDRWRWVDNYSGYRLYFVRHNNTTNTDQVVLGEEVSILSTDYIRITNEGHIYLYESYDAKLNNIDSYFDDFDFSTNEDDCREFGEQVCAAFNPDPIHGVSEVGFTMMDTSYISTYNYNKPKYLAPRFFFAYHDWRVVVDPDLSLVNGKYQAVGYCAKRGTLVNGGYVTFDDKVSAVKDAYAPNLNGGNVYKTANAEYMFKYNVNTKKPVYGDNDIDVWAPYNDGTNKISQVTPTVTSSGITSFTVNTDSSNVSTFIAGNETVVGPIRLKASSAGTITSVNITLNNGTTKTGTIADSHGNTYASHTNVGTSYETNGNYFVKIANSELGSNRITGVKFNVKANGTKTTTVTYPEVIIIWRDRTYPLNYQPFETKETLKFSYPETLSASTQVTVNQVLTTDLKIVKKDTNGNNVKGVKFKVQRIDEVNNTSDWVNTDANYNFTSGTTESNAKVLETNANGETPIIKGLPVNYVYKLYEIDLGGNHQLVEINGKRLITPEYATVTETDTSDMSHSGINNYNGSNGRITFRNVSGNTVTVTVSNEFKPVTLSGYVWRDIKKGKNQQLRNDVKDSDENTIADITVDLLENGVVKATTTVNNDGFYKFENIPGKDINKYSVRFNYDGLKYSPVSIDTSTGSSKVNTSKATENSTKRTELNAKGENIESYDEVKVNNGITADISKEKVKSYYDALVPSASGNTISIENLNLGLYNREMPDVALTKTVTRSDIQFLNEDVSSDNMNVAFTYAITLINNSSKLTTKINAINDYFSDNLVLADNKIYDQNGNEIPAIRIQKTEELSNEEINGYNNYRIEFPEGITLTPNTSKKLFVKFNLPVESIQEFINKVLLHTTDIKNYAEIANYSIYSDNQATIPYLGYDLDSEPNNFKDGKNEDDNDNASGMRTVELLVRNILSIISNNSRNTTVNSSANNTRNLRTTNSLQNITRSVETPDSTDAESGEESNDNNGTEEGSDNDGEGESNQNSDVENDAEEQNGEDEEQENLEKLVLTTTPNYQLRNSFFAEIDVNHELKTGEKIVVDYSDYMDFSVTSISDNNQLYAFHKRLDDGTRIIFDNNNAENENQDIIEASIDEENSIVIYTAINDVKIGTITIGIDTNDKKLLEYSKTIDTNVVNVPINVKLIDLMNNELYTCNDTIDVGINKVSIVMESPTEGQEIKAGDTVVYKIKAKNEGKVTHDPDDLYYVNVMLLTKTPEELGDLNVVYNNWKISSNLENSEETEEINENEEQQEEILSLVEEKNISFDASSLMYDSNNEETYNIRIPLLIPYNEEVEVVITGKVKEININKEIKIQSLLSNNLGIGNLYGDSEEEQFNFTNIENVNNAYSNIIKHKIVNSDSADDSNTEDNIENEDIENKKLDFKVENYITKIITKIDGENTEKEYNNVNLAKLEIKSRDIDGAIVKVEYKIVVTNNGELPGTVGKIIDYIPDGMSLDTSNNLNWIINADGTIENRMLSTELLKPGQSKEFKLVLTKTMQHDTTGVFNNKVVLQEISSVYNVNDINSQNNTSNAELIISIGTGTEAIIIIALSITMITFIVLVIKFKLYKRVKHKAITMIVIGVIFVSGLGTIIVNAVDFTYVKGSQTYTVDGDTITIKRRLMITGRVTRRHRLELDKNKKIQYTPFYYDMNNDEVIKATNTIKVSLNDSIVIDKYYIYINPTFRTDSNNNTIIQSDNKVKFSGIPLQCEAFYEYVKKRYPEQFVNAQNPPTYVSCKIGDTNTYGNGYTVAQRTAFFLYTKSDWQVVVDPLINNNNGIYLDVGDCVDKGVAVNGIPVFDNKASSVGEVFYEYYTGENTLKLIPNNCCTYNDTVEGRKGLYYQFSFNRNSSLTSGKEYSFIYNGTSNSNVTATNSVAYKLEKDNNNITINCTNQGDYIVIGSIPIKANRTGGTLNTTANVTLSNGNVVTGELSWSTAGQYTGSKSVGTTANGFYVRVLKSKVGNNTIKSVKLSASTSEYDERIIKVQAKVVWRDQYSPSAQRFTTKEDWTLKFRNGYLGDSISFDVNYSSVNYANLKIKKVDSTGNNVKGVKFKVQRIDEKNNTTDWINTDSNYNFTSGTTESNAKVLETNASGETPVIKGLPVNYVYKLYEIDLGENHQLVEINGKKLITPEYATVTETDTSNMSHSGINNYNGSNGRITFRNVSGNTVTVTVKNNVKPVSLSGYVWEDGKQGKNEQVINNQKDTNDKVLSGISVELLLNGNPQQPPVTAITDLTGKYTFNNLDAKNIGKYSVRFNYDGLKYAPVTVDTATNISPKENTSKATEDSTIRNTLNNKSVNITSHENIKTGNDITAQITATNIQAYYNVISKTSTDSTINIPNLNLGLLQREMPDLALVKDIYGADVEFNGAKYTYYFGQGLDKKAENSIEGNIKTITSLGIQVENEVDNNHKYSLPIYESDVEYLKETNDPGKLKVNITYAIGLVNNSFNLIAGVKEINEYFSDNISLTSDKNVYLDSQCTRVIGHIDEIENFNQNNIKKAKIVLNEDIIIRPNSSMNLYIKYSLPTLTFYDFVNQELYSNINIRNMSEISKYTVMSAIVNNNNKIYYLGYDYDSEPNNFENGINEDDNDITYGIKIVDAGERIVKGTVFEDKKIRTETDENGNKISIGNSIFDSGENTIKNAKVNIINLDNPSEKVKVYDNIQKKFVDYEEVSTDENGNYEIKGLIPGNYQLQFIWGNGTVSMGANGMDYVTISDYNSTLWSEENTELHNQENWYLPKTSQIRFSDAKDDVKSQNTMIDTTPKFTLGIEVDDFSVGTGINKVPCLGIYQFILDKLDFGLIKKPVKTIKLTKRIQHIRMSAEGVLLVDSDILYDENGNARLKNDNMKHTKYIPASQADPFGMIQAEIDNTIFPIDIEITYEITASYEDLGETELNNIKIFDYLDDILENKNIDNVNITTKTISDYNSIVKNNTKIEQGSYDVNNLKIYKMYNEWSNNILSGRTAKLSNKKIYELNELENSLKLANERETVSTTFKVVGKIANNANDISLVNDVEAIIVDESLDNETPYTSYMDRAQKVVITPQTGENRNYGERIIVTLTIISAVVILGVGIILIKKKVM